MLPELPPRELEPQPPSSESPFLHPVDELARNLLNSSFFKKRGWTHETPEEVLSYMEGASGEKLVEELERTGDPISLAILVSNYHPSLKGVSEGRIRFGLDNGAKTDIDFHQRGLDMEDFGLVKVDPDIKTQVLLRIATLQEFRAHLRAVKPATYSAPPAR